MYLNCSATIEQLRGEQSGLHAEVFAAIGVPVFPSHTIKNGKCSCREGAACSKGPGKHPRWERNKFEHGLYNATTDMEQIRRWSAKWPYTNWAIRTGDYLPAYGGYFFAIDIDPRHGGDKDLEAYEAKYGPLPRRHLVRTGGGGLHFLLVSPVPVGKGKLGDGIDIQGEGCYVIAAGSNHISGNNYELIGEPITEPLAMVPDSWLPLLPKPKQTRVVSITPAERSKPIWTKTAEGWQLTDAKTGEVKGVLADMTQRLPDPKLDAMLLKRRQNWAKKRAKRQAKRQAKQRVPKQPAMDQQVQQTAQKRSRLLCAICNICDCDPGDDVVSRVWYCLERCLVRGPKMTNDAIKGLACGLRNIPELADKTAEELLPLVSFWFKHGKQGMSKASWGSVWKRWLYTWNEWSRSQVGPAWDAARKFNSRAFIEKAEQSDHDGLFILKAICNDIQEHAADGRWFLTCRTAADVLASFGIDITHMTANRWLAGLVDEGFLIKDSYKDPSNPKTQWYLTAAFVAAREEHDREQQLATVASCHPAPRTRMATARPVFYLSHAGRDETAAQIVATCLMANSFASQRAEVLRN